MSIYPWQQAQWQQLWSAHRAGRLPHALLLTGLTGTGKTLFADVFANALLCTDAEHQPCGKCHGCHLTIGHTHPNKIIIAPEKPGAAIKVDQVREISEFIQQTALIGDRRIVIVQQANNMNVSAANALLKTLEEPAAGALLMLISDEMGQLPATIVSRCQRMLFSRPGNAAALDWLRAQLKNQTVDADLLLRIAHGAPLKALQLAEEDALLPRKKLYDALSQQAAMNPVAIATELSENEPLVLLDYALGFLVDLLRLKLGEENITSSDYLPQLTALKSISIDTCVTLMSYLQQVRQQILSGVNFNKQLLLESILMRWKGVA